MTDVAGYTYGLVVFAGGAIGFLKAGSRMSLLAGTIFGLLAACGAHLENKLVGLIVSALLLFVMGSRFYRGRKFMPAGLVSLLSLLMVIRYALITLK